MCAGRRAPGLKGEMCFCLPQVDYLGHIISKEGLCPAASKVKAIKEGSKPHHCLNSSHSLALSIIMPSFARLSNHPCPTLQITEKF